MMDHLILIPEWRINFLYFHIWKQYLVGLIPNIYWPSWCWCRILGHCLGSAAPLEANSCLFLYMNVMHEFSNQDVQVDNHSLLRESAGGVEDQNQVCHSQVKCHHLGWEAHLDIYLLFISIYHKLCILNTRLWEILENTDVSYLPL